jgi:hypothetical protein
MPTTRLLIPAPARLAAAASIALVGAAWAQPTVHFSDGDFIDADWSAQKIFDTTTGQTATFDAHQVTTGGNPGAFRYVRHDYCRGTMIVAHTRNDAVYSPAARGAIASISPAFDLIQINPRPDQAVGYGILLLQGATYYTTPVGNTIFDGAWTHFDLGELRAADLQRLIGPGPATPDFSASGGDLHFGYYSSNSSSGACLTRESGIDNWSVVTRRSCPADMNADGQVNVQDFLLFLQLFAGGGDTRADFNGDGQINVADFLAFLQSYSTGCS